MKFNKDTPRAVFLGSDPKAIATTPKVGKSKSRGNAQVSVIATPLASITNRVGPGRRE